MEIVKKDKLIIIFNTEVAVLIPFSENKISREIMVLPTSEYFKEIENKIEIFEFLLFENLENLIVEIEKEINNPLRYTKLTFEQKQTFLNELKECFL